MISRTTDANSLLNLWIGFNVLKIKISLLRDDTNNSDFHVYHQSTMLAIRPKTHITCPQGQEIFTLYQGSAFIGLGD